MITYEIDKQQPKKSNKRILEAKLELFIIALILALAFFVVLFVEGV
ncbi:hypothetical protein [Helicobacter pylori]|nr:hypothetical protein [Helicobacter pylori]